MRIVPSDATLGATVTDVDLGSLDEAMFAAIESAWFHYAVLVFPGQALTDAEHIAFTRRFGRLERGLKRAATAGLGRLSNVDRSGTVVPAANIQARFQRGNREWHSDSSYKRVGAKASILAAHVTPSEGGETEWADMRAAWTALAPSRQEWLANKIAVHSYRFSHTWHGGLEILNDDDLAGLPPVEHPLMRIHPDTGRPSLFVGRHASHIVGEDIDNSRRLLRDLTREACQPATRLATRMATRRHRDLGQPLRPASRPSLGGGRSPRHGPLDGGRRRTRQRVGGTVAPCICGIGRPRWLESSRRRMYSFGLASM